LYKKKNYYSEVNRTREWKPSLIHLFEHSSGSRWYKACYKRYVSNASRQIVRSGLNIWKEFPDGLLVG